MNFYSTRNRNLRASLRTAVIDGLAADGGLFLPESITPFSREELASFSELPFIDLSFMVARRLLDGSLPDQDLRGMVERAFPFEAKLVELQKNLYVDELFHGPTLAFKDFGARFLAQVLGHFACQNERDITVLVATSGDTGGAVAAGFYRTPGVRVALLYPRGRVSPLQEKQLTSFGENIHAFEVDGSFDDCQALVKQAFNDTDLKKQIEITSANSINIARLIPQTFYYFSAWTALGTPDAVSFAVPSGNFGNISAGVIARMLGLPIKHLIAGTNINDTVPRYLSTGRYEPGTSVLTISNAMDVGNPSNVERLNVLHEQSLDNLRKHISAVRFTDQETRELMIELKSRFGYLAEPHTAIAYGASKHIPAGEEPQVLLATAHPIKFSEVVSETLGIAVPLPEELEALMQREKLATPLTPDYQEFRRQLLSHA